MGLVAAAGLGVSTWLQRRARGGTHLTLTPVVQAVLEDRGSPAVGATHPAVTIVLFTDCQCPVCKATDPALQAMIATDITLRVIFKDWPIFGDVSKAAAKWALAAHRQGRYLAMHRGLMAARRKLDPPVIEEIARVGGVDWPQLVSDHQTYGATFDAQLGQHAMQAFSLGLQGTPAYVVGAALIEGGLDANHLAQAIKAARRDGPPKPD